MIWAQLIYYVITLILSIALSPKPKAPKPAAIDDFDFPTAEEGRPIPAVFGTVDITGANVLWYGDLSVGKIRKRSGFSKATVGYKYYLGLHMGLCHGPVDAITRIAVGDKQAWAGNVTTSSSFAIAQASLFGGDKREGGILANIDVCMGEDTQVANPYLETVLDTPVPAFRGITAIVARGGLFTGTAGKFLGTITLSNKSGAYIGTQAYPKPWSVRVTRILNGWLDDDPWYPAKAVVTMPGGGTGMNPAHIVYQALTDTRWGMGVPPTLIDTTNFQDIADTLFDEGFGLNIIWTQGSTIEQFLQTVFDHIYGGLTFDLATGKYKISIFRADYDPDDLDEFDSTNTLRLDKFEKNGLGENVNEVTVTYSDPDSFKLTTITAQDLANVDSQGAKIPAIVDLKGIRDHVIAREQLGRELAQRVRPLTKITIQVNRAAWFIGFGGLFKFNWPEHQCYGRVFRVLKIGKGTLQDNAISIDALEDIYSRDQNIGLATQEQEASAPGLDPPDDEEGDTTANNVISSTTTAPPASNSDGDRYIVPGGATGAWAGHDGELVEWDEDANAWHFDAVPDGEIVYVNDTGETMQQAGGSLQSFQALSPLSPDPSGFYTNADVTIDEFGRVVEASSNPGAIPALGVFVQSVADGTWYGHEGFPGDRPAWSRDGSHWFVETQNTHPSGMILYGPDDRYHGLSGQTIGYSNTRNLNRGWTYVNPTGPWPLAGFTGGVAWSKLIEVGGVYYAWHRDMHNTASDPDYPFIIKSVDDGVTWTEVGINNLPKQFVLVDLMYTDDISPTTWLAFGHFRDEVTPGVFEFRPRVYESTDLLTFALLDDIAVTPASDNWQVNVVARDGLNIVVGLTDNDTGDAQLMWSDDGGASWNNEAAWPVTTPDQGIVGAAWDGTRWLVGGRDWVGRSTDMSTWTIETNIFGLDESFSIAATYGGRTLFALTTADTFRTVYTDDGETFIEVLNLPYYNHADLISYNDELDDFSAKTVQERFQFTGTGGGGGGDPVPEGASGARCYRDTDQSIPNSTLTALLWPVENYDTDTYHSTSSNTSRFVAPTDGKYNVGCSVKWDSNTTGTRELYVVVNGVTGTRRAGSLVVASAGVIHAVVDTIDLAAGDYIEFYVNQNSGGARNVTATEQITNAYIHRVGVTAAPTQLRGATFVRSVAIATPIEDVDVYCPVKGRIVGVRIGTKGGPGSCVVDIWKDTHANYPPTLGDSICASAKPTISSGVKYEDTTLTGWTTLVNAGDWLTFHLESNSNFKSIFIQLAIRETQ